MDSGVVRSQAEEFDDISEWRLGRVHPTPETIPASWRLCRLTSIAKLESGHTPSRRKPSYWNGDILWVSLHDSEQLDCNLTLDTSQTISELGLANSSARLLPEGTVVFSRTATVGKCTVLGRPMATSQDFANYICGPELHNSYLMYLFRFMQPEWERLMAGSTHNTIYMPVFKQLQILVPPLPEQRAISEALSDVDGLIAELEALVAKKRDLKQAAAQTLLTGETRLPGFSGDWRKVELGVLANIVSGGTPSSTKAEYWNGGIPWCTPTDITECEGNYLHGTPRTISEAGLTASAATLLPVGTILLCSRATLGDARIAAVPMTTNQGFKSLVVDSQQVVLGETESTDGCLIFNPAMGSMEVVSMRPVIEACGSVV